MNGADGSGGNFRVEDGENSLPVINGERERSKMLPVDIDIDMRGDEEHPEVKN